MLDRGLYVHIPFCIKKCRYCDFVSFTSGDKREYLSALKKEMKKYNGEKINTVFIGGGTPTSLESSDLYDLFEFIGKNFRINENYEWTVEMNPKTFDREKLLMMKEAGVNRVSVGVQSFCDGELEIIGRVHNSSEAKEAISVTRDIFPDFNIDLMSALPGQSIESFISSLNTALSFSPTHISCYSLILEEGTELNRMNEKGMLDLPDEDSERKMYETAKRLLEENGYKRYEISNFAKPGFECMHNLKYWNCDEYIGAGLAAHSYIDGVRYANTSCMKNYIEGKTEEERIILTANDMKSEYIIMSLRLANGIDETEYQRRFKSNLYDEYGDVIDKYIKYGLLERKGSNYSLTDDGISVSNTVMCEFV